MRTDRDDEANNAYRNMHSFTHQQPVFCLAERNKSLEKTDTENACSFSEKMCGKYFSIVLYTLGFLCCPMFSKRYNKSFCFLSNEE
jgi:hypothetical protein